MTTSGACVAGACSACRCTATTCEHGCHVDGAARTSPPVPPPTIVVDNPAFLAAVEIRAGHLCTAAEPHDGVAAFDGELAACTIHVSEARRQLFEQYLGQSGAA